MQVLSFGQNANPSIGVDRLHKSMENVDQTKEDTIL